jgi:hypothetical protein
LISVMDVIFVKRTDFLLFDAFSYILITWMYRRQFEQYGYLC